MNQKTDIPEIAAVTEFLSRCLPFDRLPHGEQVMLARQLDIRYFRRGHRFMAGANEGDGLRIVRSGAVEIQSQDGQLLDRLGEGESFAIAGLDSEHSGVKAVLIEDSLIYRLPPEAYTAWREKYRDFDRFFHHQRSRRLRRAARYEPDTNALMRPIAELMSKDVLYVTPTHTIQETAQAMNSRRVSSIVVMNNEQLVGIVTDRDLRSRAVAQAVDLNLPITAIMTQQPFAIEADATLFDATLMMTKVGCHHLPVVAGDQLVGILTASDLMLAKQDDPVYLVQHISRQTDIEGMRNVVESLPSVMRGWVKSGVRAHQVSRILTAISDAITQRLIHLAIRHLGEPPVPFAWLCFGSQARAEQLLGADQDNGLLIDDSVKQEHLPWFESLAHFVCDGLNICGYPYCNGEIMATTDPWRQPLSAWKKTVDSWTRSPTPDAVMRVSIFFDIRVAYGDPSLGKALQAHMLEKASKNTIFLAALASNVLEHTPPLGVFRRFIVERSGEHRDTIDLKKRGVMPIIDMVRIHALAHCIDAVNTRDRIEALIKAKVLTIGDGRNLQDAFDFIMQQRVQNQAAQLERGENTSNYCNPNDLPELARKHLRDAFTAVHDSQQSIRLNYRRGMGG